MSIIHSRKRRCSRVQCETRESCLNDLEGGVAFFSCSILSRRYTIVVLHKHMTDVDLDAIESSWSIMMIVVVISRYIRHCRRFETPRLWLTCQPCRSSMSTSKLRPLPSRCPFFTLPNPYRSFNVHSSRTSHYQLGRSSTKYLPHLSRLELHIQLTKH